MAKKLTIALAVIMLIVGFAVGLIASPLHYCTKLNEHRCSLDSHTADETNTRRNRPNLATLSNAEIT